MLKGLLQGLLGDEIWFFGIASVTMESVPAWLLILFYVLIIIGGYLLGSLNTAIVFSKLVYGEDIRTKGSGNAGMTNMMRTYGKGPAAVTFLGDLLKTLLALFLGTMLCGMSGAYVAGVMAIIGHIFPIYYRFHGGKGVASSAMFVLYFQPITFLILVVVFVFTVAVTKFLSLASILCALIYPLMMYRLEESLYLYPYDRTFRLLLSLIACLLVFYMHRTNMQRLMKGKENKFSFKKTQKRTPKTSADPTDSETKSDM